MNIQELRNIYADTVHLAPEQFGGLDWLEIKWTPDDEQATADDTRRLVFDRPGLIASNLKCDLIGWYATSSHAIANGLALVREVRDLGEGSPEIETDVRFTAPDGIVHDGGSAVAEYLDLPYELVFDVFGYQSGTSLAEARAQLKRFIDKQTMEPMELLCVKDTVDEDVMKEALRSRTIELHFNGRLLWGDIVAAIVAARRELASGAGIDADEITPRRLVVAVYHTEEQAIYVAIEFGMPGHGVGGAPRVATGEQILRKGKESGQVEMETVSAGTSAKILELMDAIDLKKAIWLPYSE